MSADRNWFRNTTWDEEIEQYFFKKLKRVRNRSMQAQYLKLQAGALAYTKNVELMQKAEQLLHYLFREYTEEEK